MLRKILILVTLAILSLGTFNGCYYMGKATGEVAEEVEEGAEDFQEGYEEGKE